MPDAIDYRLVRADEETDVLSLWAACLPVPAERLRYEHQLDPDRLRRTFVAVDATGVLSAVAYAHRRLGDSSGRPQLVGAVTCVATRESARGRGYARRLLDLALAAMRDEGCAWSLLFTDVPGYYERIGWKTMTTRYREGPLARERSPLAGEYSVQPFDPTDPAGWAALAEAYDRYNAKRPLCLARSPEYWRSWVAPRFTAPTALVLVARRRGAESGIAGYLLAHIFDEAFVVSEIAADRPGEGIALALLGSLADRVASRGVGGGRAYLPFESEIDQALGQVFAELSVGYHHAMATKPVASDFGQASIDAVFAAPGAIYWPSDDF